jgi:hypothetical protein
MEGKLSILNPLPGDYAKDLKKFKSVVASYVDRNFLLVPAGGNKVRIIHNCFIHGDPESTTVVVGTQLWTLLYFVVRLAYRRHNVRVEHTTL